MKTAIVAALACAALFCNPALARECPVGKSTLWVVASKKSPRPPVGTEDWDRSTTDYVIGVTGRIATSYEQLKNDYRLESSVLHVTYGTRPSVELALGRYAMASSGCLAFTGHAAERPTRNGIDRVAGASVEEPEYPALCLSADGRVTGQLAIDVNSIARPLSRTTPPELHLGVVVNRRSDGEKVLLLDTDESGGCTE